MSLLNLCTKYPVQRKAFESFAQTLVEDGVRDFERLCYADKCELVGLLIPALDCPYEFLVESNDTDQMLHSFSKFMQNNSRDTKDTFIDTIRDQAINYFASQLRDYINELVEERHYAVNEDYYNEHPHLLDTAWQVGARR